MSDVASLRSTSKPAIVFTLVASARRLLAVVLTAGIALAPVGTPIARALDICSTNYCASIQIVQLSGTGHGHITSDPAGIDCTETPSGFSGTCFSTFVWSYLTSSIYVDMTISADSHDYVCIGSTCSGVGGSIGTSIGLAPGDAATMSPEFHLAAKHTVTLSLGGSGSGRATTSPPGLDCRISHGVVSGVCTFDYYLIPGPFEQIKLHLTPRSGSYACEGILCSVPNKTMDGGLGLASSSSKFKAEFWKAVPLTVTVTGHGSVISSPAAISCPTKCSKWLPPAGAPPAPWILTAKPAKGWFLKDWTGACDSATGATCDYYSGFSGGKVGVIFETTATPRPPTAPYPTTTPRPTSGSTSQRSSAAPSTATPEPSAGPTVEPSTAVEPTGSEAPKASEPGVASDGSGASPVPSPGDPVGAGGAGGGTDSIFLLGAAFILFAALATAFLVGRRGRRGGAPPS